MGRRVHGLKGMFTKTDISVNIANGIAEVQTMEIGEPKLTRKQIVLLVVALLGLMVVGVLLAIALGLY